MILNMFRTSLKAEAWNIYVQFHPHGNEEACHTTRLNPSRDVALRSIYNIGFKFIFLVPFHPEFWDSLKLIFALL